MPKSKKVNPPDESPQGMQPATGRARRWALNGLAALLLGGGCAAGIFYARQYVDENVAPPTDPPAVVFANRPAWMTDRRAQQIIDAVKPAGGKSVFDHELLVATADGLRANPWVARVKEVRRVYGRRPGDTLEVDCDFRAPMALAQWGDDYWLVDAHGVKLPEKFSARELPQVVYAADGKTNVRVIEGVRRAPPREPGEQWAGEDLAAGLDLAARLYGQPFAQEVVKIDVANFAGRVDPKEAQLVLVTRYNTEVRWGRPWEATDGFIEASPERKVDSLRRVVAEYGRIDARQPWIDVRFDKVTYPCPVEATSVEAGGGRGG